MKVDTIEVKPVLDNLHDRIMDLKVVVNSRRTISENHVTDMKRMVIVFRRLIQEIPFDPD